ncbi:MAG TPA: DUF6263 family protein [Planctomycetota bacterium]
MILLILALLAPIPTQDPPKADIGWSLKPGQRVRYEMEKTTRIHMKEGTVEMKMILGLVLEAGEGDGKGATALKVTIDRVVMSGSGDKDAEDYDSDRDKTDPKHPSIRIMAGCLNGKFEAKISNQGAISDIRGLKEVLEKSVENVPEVKAKGDTGAAARFADSIDQFMQEAFTLAPGSALANGATWDSTPGKILFGAGEAPLKIKSTVKEIRAGKAVISRAMELDFSKDERNPDAKGSGTGEVIWSTERGIALSGQWRLHVATSRTSSDVLFSLKLAPREKK